MTDAIACVACLDPRLSVHTPTFLKAVGLAGEQLVEAGRPLVLYDDRADAATARRVADQIAATQPRCVVGHFASAAAAAAAPVYAAAGIPLLLPAATAAALTGNTTTYRVCDSDADYVCWLVEAMAAAGLEAVEVLSDGSAHGDSVAAGFRTAAHGRPPGGAPATLFAGSHAASISFAHRFTGRDLVLTDDADAPGLAEEVAAGRAPGSRLTLHVAALRPVPTGEAAVRLAATYRDREGRDPGTYFWETLAAIQLAASVPAWPPARPVPTVLGNLLPGHDRECRPRSFAFVTVGRW